MTESQIRAEVVLRGHHIVCVPIILASDCFFGSLSQRPQIGKPTCGDSSTAIIWCRVFGKLFLANVSVVFLKGKCSDVGMWKPDDAAEWELSVSGSQWQNPGASFFVQH